MNIGLWNADAIVLFDWLMTVDLSAVPTTHLGPKQALMDLLTRLEQTAEHLPILAVEFRIRDVDPADTQPPRDGDIVGRGRSDERRADLAHIPARGGDAPRRCISLAGRSRRSRVIGKITVKPASTVTVSSGSSRRCVRVRRDPALPDARRPLGPGSDQEVQRVGAVRVLQRDRPATRRRTCCPSAGADCFGPSLSRRRQVARRLVLFTGLIERRSQARIPQRRLGLVQAYAHSADTSKRRKGGPACG
jgi:hypothetical protein